MSTIFSLLTLPVMPLWFAMIFAPRAKLTRRVMASPWVLVPVALAYCAIVLPQIATILPPFLRPELPTVAALLGTELGATAAWAHFLVFDAFVGRWIHADALARGMSGWVLGPILFFTLMLGPLGFTLYLLLRPRAQAAAGQPAVLTIDRGRADANRAAAQAGHIRVEGRQLDEYPPAMFREGGAGAGVRLMSPRDNMGAGACIGNQCRGLPNGTRVRIVVE